MKTKLATLLHLFGGAVLTQAASSEWTTILRQTEVGTGVEYIAVVSSSGSQLSMAPLTDQGAVFQLWGVKGETTTLQTTTTSTGTGHYNNGHGNNVDGVDVSNPGQGGGGPNGEFDESGTFDDEKKLNGSGNGSSSSTTTTSTTTTPAEEHLLDTELVGVYQPAATITISTEDPHTTVYRTRSDRPFSVSYNVSGLIAASEGVEAASQVLLTHDAKSYSDAIFIDGNYTQTDNVYTGYITANGTTTQNFACTNLPTTDPLKGIGIEVFTIDALPDYQVPSTRLATATLEVYPVPKVEITGVTEGETYENIPTVSVSAVDLYPDSTVFVRVYPDGGSSSTATVVPESVIVVDDVTSQDKEVDVTNWSDVIDKDGTWTIEVVTQTPNTDGGVTEEVNDTKTIVVDWTIEVNGQVFSSEK